MDVEKVLGFGRIGPGGCIFFHEKNPWAEKSFFMNIHNVYPGLKDVGRHISVKLSVCQGKSICLDRCPLRPPRRKSLITCVETPIFCFTKDYHGISAGR